VPEEIYELVNCVLCGRAFARVAGSRKACPECTAETDELYRQVRNLLGDYPDRRLGTSDIAKLLNVEERKINYLIDCGMFNVITDIGLFNSRQEDGKMLL
jgi:hypothetical protein